MGTRHLIAVMINGEYKVAQYGQWDGYPEGQGIEILSFLQDNKRVANLKTNLSKTRFIDKEKDKDFLEAYEKNAPKWSNDPDNRTSEQIRWFMTYISRDIGAGILSALADSKDEEILLKDSVDFASDSLYCEYAYVIDFDKNTLEVFRGFNKESLDESERFANLPKTEHKIDNYFPVKFWKKFDLNHLPAEEKFLKELEEKEE